MVLHSTKSQVILCKWFSLLFTRVLVTLRSVKFQNRYLNCTLGQNFLEHEYISLVRNTSSILVHYLYKEFIANTLGQRNFVVHLCYGTSVCLALDK